MAGMNAFLDGPVSSCWFKAGGSIGRNVFHLNARKWASKVQLGVELKMNLADSLAVKIKRDRT